MRYKPQTLILLMTLIFSEVVSQVPTISAINKKGAANGELVLISGTNFGTNAANIVVWMGSAKASIQTISDNAIEVVVPPAASYDEISVTNITTGKTAWSNRQFLPSYHGASPISSANLQGQTDLDTEAGLYDLFLCDLDGDGKPDIVGSSSGSSGAPPSGLSIYRNTSTAGSNFTFAAKVSALPTTKLVHVVCGDLDGDGKKEIIASEGDPGNRIFVLKNNSTTGSLSFTAQSIPLTGKSPKRIDVADLDRDGRADLIITDQKTENKDLIILPNTTTGSTITFGAVRSLALPVTGTAASDGLAVQDLDNDSYPEIVINQYLSAAGNIFIYKNKSSAGNLLFGDAITLALAAPLSNTGTPVNLRVGDIDGDSKPDIAVTQLLASKISIFLNQSTEASIQFGSPVAITTDPFPWGIDIGDIDGDGKADLVVASLTGPVIPPPGTDVNPKSLTILNNSSTVGTVSFPVKVVMPTTYVNRHVMIGDVDGDSKPDIAYTSVDDNARGVSSSKLSFFRNKSCIKPVADPPGPLNICSSLPLVLNASLSAGAGYQWKKDGTPIGGATTSTFTPTASGNYTVDVTSDGCTQSSNVVTITVGAGSATAPVITNNSPVCEGGTINLSATSTGATAFHWTGPAGFDVTGASVSRTSYVPEFAGRYDLEVFAGSCVAQRTSVLVSTVSLPPFTVGFTGSDIICAGDTKTLTASPNDANYTYQWYDANGLIAGATTSSYSINNTGTYHFTAQSILYPGCPKAEAPSASFLKASIPVAAFQAPAESCKDTPVTFTNQSTVDSNAGANFTWDFGDAGTSTDTSPLHTYASINTFSVKLTAAYRGNACAVTLTKPIKISAPPTATITTPGGVFSFCEGTSLTLGVSATFLQYAWSTSATTATVDVTTGGSVSVQVTDAAGCKVTATQAVTMLPAPDITIAATPNPINLGESSQLEATAGLSNYSWTPTETLDNAAVSNPVATPSVTTTYTVTADGANGCSGTATVELLVGSENPTNLLKPANFFSPNGSDNINPTWSVGNILSFPQCGVTIFDERGMKVYEAKPYLNDWDGTSNGRKLPDGVYYYVIRCDGENKPKTGSITLVR